MKCPFCSHPNTKVVDKREPNSLEITRRRRECLNCKKRFTTYEKVESANLIVIKKDNRREKFDIEKLKKGLTKACEKRPVALEKIEEIAEKIEEDLRKLKSKEIKSSIIGEKVINSLKKLDHVAYIRFASIYREFKDLEDFKEELKKLTQKS